MVNKKLRCPFCNKEGKAKESFLNKNNLIPFDNGSLLHKECINQILEKIDKYQNENIGKIQVMIKGSIFKEEIVCEIFTSNPFRNHMPELTHPYKITDKLWNTTIVKKLGSEFLFQTFVRANISIPNPDPDNIFLLDYFSKKINVPNKNIRLQMQTVNANDEKHLIAFQEAVRRREREKKQKLKEEIEFQERIKQDIKKAKQREYSENLAKERARIQANPILQKKLDFENGLEAIIEIDFPYEREVKTRYFLSKDNKDLIYSRDFFEMSSNNFIHFQINVSMKDDNTRWNYEGDKEIGDNFEDGYTLVVTMKEDDKELRYMLIQNLREFGFGVIPSSKTMHCHKDSKLTTNEAARKCLREIVEKLSLDEKYLPQGPCGCGHNKIYHDVYFQDAHWSEHRKKWNIYDIFACNQCSCKKYNFNFTKYEKNYQILRDVPHYLRDV